MTTEVSDIDLMYSRWCNNSAIVGGAMTAIATTVALAKIGEMATNYFTNWDDKPALRGLVLLSAAVAGVAAGHYVTANLIGLIAKSAIGKLAISLTFNSIGALTGLGLYHSNRSVV